MSKDLIMGRSLKLKRNKYTRKDLVCAKKVLTFETNLAAVIISYRDTAAWNVKVGKICNLSFYCFIRVIALEVC